MVSVIIPVYNSKPYLYDLIESLVGQEHKDFEVIFVDDGSNDGSREVLHTFFESSELNMQLFHQSNSGPSAARNIGIARARGELICFVDADDVVSPSYISSMLHDMSKYRTNLAVCNDRAIYDSKLMTRFTDVDRNIQTLTSNELLNNFLFNRTNIGITLMLIKKEIIIENNIWFNESYSCSEDTEFIWKVLCHINRAVVNSNVTYHYRVRPNSLSTDFSEKNIRGIELIRGLNTYIAKHQPQFAKVFEKYVGSILSMFKLKEAAVATNTYSEFLNYANLINPHLSKKSLLTLPVWKIRAVGFLYLVSPFWFYKIIRRVVALKTGTRQTGEGVHCENSAHQ